MKSVLRYTAAGVALATLGFASNASAATAQANAQAQILASLTVVLDSNTTRDSLTFGSIAESGSGGTVTLTTANVRTCSAGLLCSGTTEVPQFNITGAANAPIAISFVSNTIPLTGPGAPMNVDLTASVNNTNLSAGGTANFTVGGLLTVGAGQVAGTYTGQVNVNVLYN